MADFALHQHPVNIEDEMKRSYMDYAMSVIIGRALPDARDGLKPAHRRVLYGMKTMGLSATRGYRKCAKIVGEVMGNFHPHGDQSIYDTLVRMAQDFNMRYPLVDGQGNFGSVDGDMPAAMRYTEARLARIAEELLADIERETVDFVPNFDETEKEPVVLPTRIPNLLVNGASGIAVGMATNIPPHNLREIIDATLLMVEKPETTLKEVMKLVPGPDTSFITSLRVVSGFSTISKVASMISRKLCGGMLVAMPTAMPLAPLTRRFGIRVGRTTGSFSVSSKLGTKSTVSLSMSASSS